MQKIQNRLPNSAFAGITKEDVEFAINQITLGKILHRYGDSIKFDLVCVDGRRLPPKAVFGVAASHRLGYEILPENFTGGIGSICFQQLEKLGYQIKQKQELGGENEFLASETDSTWMEGNPKLVIHWKRERSRRLAKKKKADFRKRNEGLLFCEHCGFKPLEKYGNLGDACIEIHHTLPVATMGEGHETTLDELLCLCANCHRVEHEKLRKA